MDVSPSVRYDTEFLVEPGDGSAPHDATASGHGGSARQLSLLSADFADGVEYALDRAPAVGGDASVPVGPDGRRRCG